MSDPVKPWVRPCQTLEGDPRWPPSFPESGGRPWVTLLLGETLGDLLVRGDPVKPSVFVCESLRVCSCCLTGLLLSCLTALLLSYCPAPVSLACSSCCLWVCSCLTALFLLSVSVLLSHSRAASRWRHCQTRLAPPREKTQGFGTPWTSLTVSHGLKIKHIKSYKVTKKSHTKS